MTATPTALFPVTTVGSWVRSPELQAGLRKYEAGEIREEEFTRLADAGVLEWLRIQDEAGVDIVTDGEQRRNSFFAFVAEKLDGVQMMSVAQMAEHMPDPSGYMSMASSVDVVPEETKNPIVFDKIRLKGDGLAVDEARFLIQHTNKPIKVPLPGPYHLHRSGWFKAVSKDAYPTREEFVGDIVRILREELVKLRDLGVAFVQFDEPTLSDVAYGEEAEEKFMCGGLGSKARPEYELSLARDLVNEVVRGINGIHTGVHVCRGNWTRREDYFLEGNYGPLLPYLTQMNVDQLVLEMATPRAGKADVFKEYANEREIGLGVVNQRSDDVEEPAAIVARTKEFLKYFDPDKIYLNPDCGFGTFAARNLNTRETGAAKLKSIAEAAALLRQEHGASRQDAIATAKS
jgi:5-methyltetrahydropteroyltriglutamate--homocysteine methyltransferase